MKLNARSQSKQHRYIVWTWIQGKFVKWKNRAKTQKSKLSFSFDKYVNKAYQCLHYITIASLYDSHKVDSYVAQINSRPARTYIDTSFPPLSPFYTLYYYIVFAQPIYLCITHLAHYYKVHTHCFILLGWRWGCYRKTPTRHGVARHPPVYTFFA